MSRIKTRSEKSSNPHSERGSAAIEFGLTIPLLLVLLMGVVELGLAMYESMQVNNAVEAGVLYATQNGWDAAGITSAVTNATGTSGITATPAPEHFCGCPSESGISTVSCGATCAGGHPAGQYARISASLAHQTVLPYPPLPLPGTITAQSVVRLD